MLKLPVAFHEIELIIQDLHESCKVLRRKNLGLSTKLTIRILSLCIQIQNVTTDIHQRYQNLLHLDPFMGLNLGVFGFFSY